MVPAFQTRRSEVSGLLVAQISVRPCVLGIAQGLGQKVCILNSVLTPAVVDEHDRHWAVVFAGTVTQILGGVSPLAGAILVPQGVNKSQEGNATTYASLLPLKNQSSALNTDFLMSAYGVTWLGQALPGFVTNQGALEPFTLDDTPTQSMMNNTWTARTTLYGTTLNCETAEVKNETSGLTYSNNKNCSARVGSDVASGFGGLYIGYHMSQFSDFSLPGIGCPSVANLHLFLAIWEQSEKENPRATPTAIFCEPDYWTQAVNATVEVPTMTVTDIIPLGPQIPLPDSQFNRTAFEYGMAQARSLSLRGLIYRRPPMSSISGQT